MNQRLVKNDSTQRLGSTKIIVAVALGITILVNICFAVWYGRPGSVENSDQSASRTAASGERFETHVRVPEGPPRVGLGIKDAHGNELTAACSTCHANRPGNKKNITVADLDEFHVGMSLNHGSVSCLSCHNPDNYDTLRLADGRVIEYSNVIELCSQCHGPQRRDFDHGAHGGMNGYWDLTRGPRTKNTCVDCHVPHHPQFPKMKPMFKPRDRFLNDDIKH